jgi:hypothetical protein
MQASNTLASVTAPLSTRGQLCSESTLPTYASQPRQKTCYPVGPAATSTRLPAIARASFGIPPARNHQAARKNAESRWLSSTKLPRKEDHQPASPLSLACYYSSSARLPASSQTPSLCKEERRAAARRNTESRCLASCYDESFTQHPAGAQLQRNGPFKGFSTSTMTSPS